MKPSYTLLDHTADLMIRVTGKDPAGLFANAGMTLFDLVLDNPGGDETETIDIEISGADYPDLLVNFLRELLYRWTVEEKVVTMVDITAVEATALSARVTITDFQADQHTIAHEIKAVTYHQIAVEEVKDGWEATVVFDI